MSRHTLISRLLLALALTACVTRAVAADTPQERKAEGGAEKAESRKFRALQIRVSDEQRLGLDAGYFDLATPFFLPNYRK